MKKLITITFIWVSFALTASAQIINNGFESWKTDTIYELPETFLTGTYGLGYIFAGQSNVTKVNGCNGLGIRLESFENGADTFPGFIYTGKPGFEIDGGGIPYTGTPDSLKFCVRYDIASGDTALIALFFQAGGSFINIALFPITGSSGQNWTNMAFDIDTFTTQPDTLAVMVSSGGFDHPLPGSWLEIDNLAFTGTSEQIPGGNFENWTLISNEDPEGWRSVDPTVVAVNGTPTVTRVEDAFEGNAAVRIETVVLPFEDTLALITNGVIDENGLSGGKPYTGPGKPGNLGGFYKYTPVGNDTAFAYVAFTVYNGFTGQTETLGTFQKKLPPSAEWDYFEVPVDLSSAILNPDTVLIVFAASDPDHLASNATVGIGSVLLLDALAFDLTDGIDNWADAHQLSIFPNPATDHLFAEWETDTYTSTMAITLFSTQGQVVYQEKNVAGIPGKNTYSLDVHNFPSGVYILQISDNDQTFVVREKVVIGK